MFPLGRPVLPGEVLGLRVFEDRYVTLLERIRDRPEPEFGVVLIDRGSEIGGGDVRRDVGTVVVAARIQQLEGGQFAVAGIGRRRIRVVEWMHDDPHPWAMVENWQDSTDAEHNSPLSKTVEMDVLADTLRQRVNSLLNAFGSPPVQREDFGDRPSTERLYGLAHRLPVGPADLQALLEADTLERRLDVMSEVLSHLEEIVRFGSSTPD
jgi:Lon protease-like protein